MIVMYYWRAGASRKSGVLSLSLSLSLMTLSCKKGGISPLFIYFSSPHILFDYRLSDHLKARHRLSRWGNITKNTLEKVLTLFLDANAPHTVQHRVPFGRESGGHKWMIRVGIFALVGHMPMEPMEIAN